MAPASYKMREKNIIVKPSKCKSNHLRYTQSILLYLKQFCPQRKLLYQKSLILTSERTTREITLSPLPVSHKVGKRLSPF
jgi:hypothetical protein